jgi:sirohydrochlorin cobaltochelatase
MNVDAAELAALEARLHALLPEQYDTTVDVRPAPMRSAGLKYGDDGLVAWNAMWASFCDLAMAGGPPHKGALLEPAPAAEIEAQPERYHDVVEEICRGIGMVTDLPSGPSQAPGWIRVSCFGEGMSGWLLRAITMENVAARADGRWLDVPAGPAFRLEKEIKNVVTVMAKTCHYWIEHTSPERKRAIADLFAAMARTTPLIEPVMTSASIDFERVSASRQRLAERLEQATSLQASAPHYAGWLGFECASVDAAIWMMRALVVSNVLARREGTTLFVPINPGQDPEGARVAGEVARVHRLAAIRAGA